MKTLLMMSLTGSLMALVVMALRALFGKRLHPRVTYALWLAAALCLLLPLRFESKMSVMNAPAARNLERSVSVRMEQPVAYGLVTGNAAQNGQSDIHYMDAPAREELESGLVQPEQSFTVDAWDVAGLIWAAGALATAGYIAIVNARFRGRVRRSRRAAAVPWVMERRLGGTKVYVSRAVPSPCLVGLFRPYIVVTPQAMAEDERFCHVLVHELSHKRQGDPLWSAVRTAVLVVHWFNPIVWVAASLSRADCENACDALTIRELGEDRRVDYGKTLLSFLRAKPTATGLVNTATTMAQSRRQIRRRISLIAKKQKYTLVAAVLCVVEIYLYFHIREYPYESSGDRFTVRELFTRPLHEKKYLYTIAVVFVWNITANVPGSYYTVYLLRNVEMAYSTITLINMLNVPIVLFLTPVWRRVLGKYGWFRTLSFSMSIYALHYFLLAAVTKERPWFYALALMLGFTFAIGINLSFTGIPYFNMPRENQTVFIGFYSTCANLAALVGVTVGKYFILSTQEVNVALGSFVLTNKQLIVVLTGVLVSLAAICVRLISRKVGDDG